MTLLLLKTLLSKFTDFFINHWRIILIALILSAVFYYKNAYERTVRELAAFKDEISKVTAKKQHENEISTIKAQNRVAAAQIKSQEEMKRLNLDRNKSIEEIKGLYENRINTTKYNFTERLRLEAERYRLGLPETASDTQRTTESGRERDTTAYRQLEQACQITTIDYNNARAWIDSACEQVGCYNN
jgi:preprotein translocase subunit SecD